MMPQPPHVPERMSLSASTMRRAVAMSRANARSAVVSSSTPGVFVMTTPAAVPAGMSRLSKPTATFATIFTVGNASSTDASTFSVKRQTSASLPRVCSMSSSRDGARSCGQTVTSKCSRSSFSPSVGMTRLTKTEGLAKSRALAAAGVAELGRDLLGGLDDRLDDAIALEVLLTDLRHGDGNRSDRPARIVEERRSCAVQPLFGLFVVLGVALAADLFELLAQRICVRDRVLREARERARGDDAVGLRAIEVREERLADGRAVE